MFRSLVLRALSAAALLCSWVSVAHAQPAPPGCPAGLVPCVAISNSSPVSGPVSVTATPANSSHAAGTSVGGLYVLPVARVSGGSGVVVNLALASKGASVGSYVVRVWDQSPANTTCTDNSAFVGSATDDARLIAGAPLTMAPSAPGVTTGDTYTYAVIGGVMWPFVTLGNSNVYVCVVTVATDTADQNNLVRVSVSAVQN